MYMKKIENKIIQTETEQQLKSNLLIPCQNKEHLSLWFKVYLNVDLADFTVSRFATTNPLDAAWIVYSHALYNESDSPLNILLIAARAGQKTLTMAAVELAIMLHDRRDILHYAAADSQAKVGWNYLTEFSSRPYIRDYLETKPTNDNLFFKIPNYLDEDEEPKKVSAKVLSITLLNAQGQHAPFVSIDELLTLSNDKRRAYYDLSGVPVSTSDGRPYIRAEISSRKGPYSVVEEKISTASKTGLIVKSWTVLENQKRCPDERSGVIPTIFYGNPKTGIVLSSEQYEELTDNAKAGYFKGNGFDKCLQCKISSFCLGDSKKQISKCKILNSIEKTITDYHNTSLDLWVSQRLSIEPSRHGLVFPPFSRERNVKNIKEIWEIYTGESINYIPSFAKLVDKMKTDGCVFYCGIDHSGGTSPYAIVTISVDRLNRVYLLDVFGEVIDFDAMTEKLKKIVDIFSHRMIYPDPASKDKNVLLKKMKFKIMDKFTKQISAGIELIKTKIFSADGTVSFFVLDERTTFFQNEIGKYHFKENSDGTYSDEPEDDHNHSIDALRYIFQNIFLMNNGNWVVPDAQLNTAGNKNDFNNPIDFWFKQHVDLMLEERTVSSSLDSNDGYLIVK